MAATQTTDSRPIVTVKIAIDIRHLCAPNPSGVGIYTERMIHHLCEAHPEDHFFLLATGSEKALQHAPTFSYPNATVVKKRAPNKWLFLLLKLPFGPTLEDWLPERPDIWLFPNFNICKTRLPYVITVHDVSFYLYPQFFTRKNRLKHWLNRTKSLLRSATSIVAVSHSTKRDLIATVPHLETPIQVTHLGVDEPYHPNQHPSDDQFRKEYNLPDRYFLTLSTLEPRKNLSSVIDAYTAWRHTLPPSAKAPSLVMAGGNGWKTTPLQEAYDASWYKDDIYFTGYVNEKHKPALYRGAKAFLFPSFYEGFGLPPLEAMACGTPVITSFTGSLPEVVGPAALLVDPYNTRDLEQALGVVSDAQDSLSELGKKQSKKFNWERTAKLTYQALETAANAG